MTTRPVDEQTIAAVQKWIAAQLPTVLASGQNWKLTIHGGKGGDLRYVIEEHGEIVPPNKRNRNFA